MSDFVLVRGLDAEALRPVFEAWKANREWVRTVEVQTRWEPQHLEINGRDAVAFIKGKRRDEFAKLVLLISENGGQVIQ